MKKRDDKLHLFLLDEEIFRNDQAQLPTTVDS